jgi:AAA family ATP:ADP antiporter
MGHYGQLTNITSLFFSYFAFPLLIRKFGLRRTLRLFPTLLLVATVVAYGALPGNLAVLFISMALLKAMTYSIHDPSKELLYLPTSNAIKFRAKFWIDVVGARVAKAIGSTINTYAGSVDQSVRVGTVPSLLTAAALWFVCYRVGFQFDRLVQDGSIVGHDDDVSRDTKGGYSKVATQEENADLEADQIGLSADEEENIDGDADDHDTNNVELMPLRPKSPV